MDQSGLPYGLSVSEPMWLYVGVGVAAVALLLRFLRRRSERLAAADPFLAMHGLRQVLEPNGRWWLRTLHLCLLALLLGVAAADPKFPRRDRVPIWSGTRIILLFDVSLSMRLAHDMPPYPDRLVAAKAAIAELMTEVGRTNESGVPAYQYALIPFAGGAKVILPFTSSLDEFRAILELVSEETVNIPGTSIGAALLSYQKLIEDSPPPKGTRDIVFLLSDGGKGDGLEEEHDVIMDTLASFPKETRILSVGIGSVMEAANERGEKRRIPQGVPLYREDGKGGAIYFRVDPNDPESEIQHSELDEEMLAKIASQGGYYHFSDVEKTKLALRDELRLFRVKTGEREFVRQEPVAHLIALLATILALPLAVPFRVWRRKFRRRSPDVI